MPSSERSSGSHSTRNTSGTWLFTLLLVGVALVDSALVFLPADTLGPLAEALVAASGKTF